MAKANKMTRSSKIISWKMARQRKTIDEISDETNITISTLRPYLKKKFKEEATKLWAARVKNNANNICEIPNCGKTNCEAHHLISKGSHPHLRYVLENGICVCNNHHYFDPIVSGHFSTSSAVNLIEVLFVLDKDRCFDTDRYIWFHCHKDDKAYQQIDFEEEYWKLAELGV